VKPSKSANNFTTPDDLSSVKSSWSEEGIICGVRAKLYDTYNNVIKLRKKCRVSAETGEVKLKDGAEPEIVVSKVYFCVDCFEQYTESPFFCIQLSAKGLATHERNSKHQRSTCYDLPYNVKIKWSPDRACYECDPVDSRNLKRAGRVSLRSKIFEEFGFDFSHDIVSLYESDVE
jgi:hypothetical protein